MKKFLLCLFYLCGIVCYTNAKTVLPNSVQKYYQGIIDLSSVTNDSEAEEILFGMRKCFFGYENSGPNLPNDFKFFDHDKKSISHSDEKLSSRYYIEKLFNYIRMDSVMSFFYDIIKTEEFSDFTLTIVNKEILLNGESHSFIDSVYTNKRDGLILGIKTYLSDIALNKLSPSLEREILSRFKQKLEEFQYNINTITDISLKTEIRKEAVISTLKLFINDGEPNIYYNEINEDTISSFGVKIELNKYNPFAKKTQKIKSYLYSLFNPETGFSRLAKYNPIDFGNIDNVKIDRISPLGKAYLCKVSYLQSFNIHREEKESYSNSFSREMYCLLNKVTIPEGDIVWDIKLGNIYVFEK